MTIDLFLLSLALLFALLGAVSGASRQVANLAALVVAYAAAYPGGKLLGPLLAAELKAMPNGLGILAATIVVFVVVVVACRVLFTALLKRLLAGKDPSSRSVDRTLGFFMGGLKVLGVAYVMLCALTFVEDNVTVAGKQLGVTPKDSLSFALARRYNVFELTHFSALRDFAEVARAASDPKQQRGLKDNEAFLALKKDPRFQKALQDRPLKSALEQGDHRLLVRHDAALAVVQDGTLAAHLRKAALALQHP
jgi:membrane protein required for colicin V production